MEIEPQAHYFTTKQVATLPPELWHMVLLHLPLSDAWLRFRHVNSTLYSLTMRHIHTTILPQVQIVLPINLSGSFGRRRWYDIGASLHFSFCQSDFETGKAEFRLKEVSPERFKERALIRWKIHREEMITNDTGESSDSEHVQFPELKVSLLWHVSAGDHPKAQIRTNVSIPLPGQILWGDDEDVEEEMKEHAAVGLEGGEVLVRKEMVAFDWKKMMTAWSSTIKPYGDELVLALVRSELKSSPE